MSKFNLKRDSRGITITREREKEINEINNAGALSPSSSLKLPAPSIKSPSNQCLQKTKHNQVSSGGKNMNIVSTAKLPVTTKTIDLKDHCFICLQPGLPTPPSKASTLINQVASPPPLKNFHAVLLYLTGNDPTLTKNECIKRGVPVMTADPRMCGACRKAVAELDKLHQELLRIQYLIQQTTKNIRGFVPLNKKRKKAESNSSNFEFAPSRKCSRLLQILEQKVGKEEFLVTTNFFKNLHAKIFEAKKSQKVIFPSESLSFVNAFNFNDDSLKPNNFRQEHQGVTQQKEKALSDSIDRHYSSPPNINANSRQKKKNKSVNLEQQSCVNSLSVPVPPPMVRVTPCPPTPTFPINLPLQQTQTSGLSTNFDPSTSTLVNSTKAGLVTNNGVTTTSQFYPTPLVIPSSTPTSVLSTSITSCSSSSLSSPSVVYHYGNSLHSPVSQNNVATVTRGVSQGGTLQMQDSQIVYHVVKNSDSTLQFLPMKIMELDSSSQQKNCSSPIMIQPTFQTPSVMELGNPPISMPPIMFLSDSEATPSSSVVTLTGAELDAIYSLLGAGEGSS